MQEVIDIYCRLNDHSATFQYQMKELIRRMINMNECNKYFKKRYWRSDQASPLPSIVPMPLEVKVTLVMLCSAQHSSTWCILPFHLTNRFKSFWLCLQVLCHCQKLNLKSREKPPCLLAPCLKGKNFKFKLKLKFRFKFKLMFKFKFKCRCRIKFKFKFRFKFQFRNSQSAVSPSSTRGQSSMLSENFNVPST